jgi:hypothetical protein
MQHDAVGLKRRKDLGGNMLVVEGDNVALPCEGTHGLDVGAVSHGRGGDHECRGRVR